MTLNMLLGPIAISQFDLVTVFSLHDILTHYLHALLNTC